MVMETSLNMNRNSLILLLIVLGIFSSVGLVHGSDYQIYKPVVEDLDLIQDGSSTYIVNLTKQFDYVNDIAFILHFTTATEDIEKFAAGNAMTNGLDIWYGSSSILNNTITQNDDLHHNADIWTKVTDAQNPSAIQYRATIVFEPALIITPQYTLQFVIQDNITALSTVMEFFVHVQGYQTIIIHDTAMVDTQDQDPLDFLELIWTSLSNPLVDIVLIVIAALLIWRIKNL